MNVQATSRRTSDELRGIVAGAAVTLVVSVAATAITYIFGHVKHVEFAQLSKDPAAALGGVFYTGYLAHFTMLVWSAPMAVSLFGALVLHRAGHHSGSLPLVIGGGITALLVFDDVFLLHEEVYPRLGIPEWASGVVYGIGTAVFMWSFRRRLRTGVLLGLLAYAFWGVAVAVDVAVVAVPASAESVIEDGAKLIGVCFWAFFLIRHAIWEISGAISVGAEPGAQPMSDGVSERFARRS